MSSLFSRNTNVRPSSETQGQSVGSRENARRKFSSKSGRPLLENFRRAFSPDPNDCPWVSEDDVRPDPLTIKIVITVNDPIDAHSQINAFCLINAPLSHSVCTRP